MSTLRAIFAAAACAVLAATLGGCFVGAGIDTTDDLVVQRGERLYGILTGKDCRHFDSRRRLGEYFDGDEDAADRFFVQLALDLDQIWVDDGVIVDYAVKKVDHRGGRAVTHTVIAGYWWLWLKRTVEREDHWVLKNGSWILDPPPPANVPYED